MDDKLAKVVTYIESNKFEVGLFVGVVVILFMVFV